MRKLKLNKLSVATLNELKQIRGGADGGDDTSNCDPTQTGTKTLDNPDLPKTGA